MHYKILFLLLLSLCTLAVSYPQLSDDIVKVPRVNTESYSEPTTSGLYTENDATEEEVDATIVNDDLIVVVKRPQHEDDAEQQQEYAHTTAIEESDEESEPMEHAPVEPTTSRPMIIVDMSDFVALIPANEVKSLVKIYYQNDADVKRAYYYMKTNYMQLKNRFEALPEVQALLNYLKAHGLDVMGSLKALEIAIRANHVLSGSDNEIFAVVTVPYIESTTVSTITEFRPGTAGLVDSILEILPQDTILMNFFTKLDNSPEFRTLMSSLSTPDFAKILSNLQNSTMLRDLIYTLQYNGIDVARILESLKAYFFLGTF